MQNINTNFLITHVDYDYSGPSITMQLFGRDDMGNRIIKHVSGTFPYFYIPNNVPVIEDPRIVKVINTHKKSIFGDSLKQIIAQKPGDVGGSNPNIQYLRDMYEKTFEADILYTYRQKIDHNLNGIIQTPSKAFINVSDINPSSLELINTRRFTLDVENCDDGTIEDAKNGDKEVYIITLHDSFNDTYHIFTSYTLTPEEKKEVTNTLNNHWKDNKFYPEFSTPKLQYHEGNEEVSLFDKLFLFIEQNRPDIITGFNSNDFDIPVICNRSKKIGLDPSRLSEVRLIDPKRPKIAGVSLMDLQKMYSEYQQGTVMYPSLDYVGGVELETKKLPRVSILELYKTNRVHLTAYNIIDVQLCVGVEKKNSLIDYYMEMAITTYTSFEDSNRSAYIDNLIFEEVKQDGLVLPSRRTIESSTDVRGGMVYEVTPGLHHNVIVLDFAGMYPSIVMALNISPETKDPNGEFMAANGIRFSSSQIGIIPKILKKLKKKRAVYKKLKSDSEKLPSTEHTKALIHQYDLKQYAVKVLMNAFYGVMNFKRFRLADPEMGDAITSTGQALSIGCRSFIETSLQFFYKNQLLKINVIYGDTDSLFLQIEGNYTPEELNEIASLLAKEINKEIDNILRIQFNVTEHDVEIEVDKIFKSLFQVPSKTGKGAKKRYAGLIYKFDEDGKYSSTKETIKGFEIVKASSAKITKDVQKHTLIKLILNEVPKSEIRNYLLNLKLDFFNKKVPIQDFSTRAPLKKPINEYPDGPEIRGMSHAIHYLKKHIYVGYVGSYYSVATSPQKYPAHKDIVLDFDEPLPDGYTINYEETWLKKVETPLVTILEAYDMDWDYVYTGKKEVKATTFFNEQNTPKIEKVIPIQKSTLGLFR